MRWEGVACRPAAPKSSHPRTQMGLGTTRTSMSFVFFYKLTHYVLISPLGSS